MRRVANKDLWEDEHGKIVDQQPEGRGRTVAVKGGLVDDADAKRDDFPKDAVDEQDEAPGPDVPPNIVISGAKGQAVVGGQYVPEVASPGHPEGIPEKDAAKDAAGRKKDKDDKDSRLL